MKIKAKTIEQIEADAEEDLKLREDRTEEDSATTPILFNKYHRQYRLVDTEYIEAGKKLLKARRDKWFYYSSKADPDKYDPKKGGVPLKHKYLKTDVKMLIDSDEEVIKLTYIVERLEAKKKFIKSIMEEINRRSFHIGNIIKTQYFKHGIN